MTMQPGSDETVVLRLLARIAALLARPAAFVHPSHFEMLGGPRVQKIAGHAAFAPFLDDAFGKALALQAVQLPEDLPRRLAEDAETRAAALIATSIPDELRVAAQLVAAAIQQKRLSTLVTRAEREEAVAQLGRMPFQVAIREAFALYPELGALAPCDPAPVGLAEETDGAELPALTRAGFACLSAFVRLVEPGLQPLFACRVPHGFRSDIDAGLLDDRRKAQLLALLRRKMPGWNEWIG